MATAAPTGYVAVLSDGTKITISNAARSHKDGAGTRFYDADGLEVASFHDGEVRMAYPASAKVEKS